MRYELHFTVVVDRDTEPSPEPMRGALRTYPGVAEVRVVESEALEVAVDALQYVLDNDVEYLSEAAVERMEHALSELRP